MPDAPHIDDAARIAPDGMVTCSLCGWRAQASSMEHAEFLVGRHLASHNLRPTTRTGRETGRTVEIPATGE